MSGISNSANVSPAIGDGDSVAIAGAAAFVIILVSSTIGWGLWMAYRTSIILSMARETQRRIAQCTSSSRTGTYVSEMSAVEMGASFLQSESCHNCEESQLPYVKPQNSQLSACLPTPPERAYVSGWAPFPPTLPRCQTLDVIRSPITISHSTSDLCGVQVVLGTSSSPVRRAKKNQIPSSPPNLINFDGDNEQRAAFQTPCAELGLSLVTVESVTDDLTVKAEAGQRTPLQAEVSVVESASGNKSNTDFIDPMPASPPLPSPLTTPILPTLVLTSAPFRISLDVKPKQAKRASQLASPPMTPTLVLTAPSVHCGLGLSIKGGIDRDVDDELERWSDILGFEEYEDDEDMLDRASCRLLDDFPSPPESPTQCSILEVPRPASTGRDEYSESTASGGSATPPQAVDDAHAISEVADNVDGVLFDYDGFRQRLAGFLKDVKDQEMTPTQIVEDTDKAASATTTVLRPSSSCTHFNYPRLHARKRSQTVSNKPAPSPQVIPLRVVPRPLPLPAEFPPLLCRAVDPSKPQVSEILESAPAMESACSVGDIGVSQCSGRFSSAEVCS